MFNVFDTPSTDTYPSEVSNGGNTVSVTVDEGIQDGPFNNVQPKRSRISHGNQVSDFHRNDNNRISNVHISDILPVGDNSPTDYFQGSPSCTVKLFNNFPVASFYVAERRRT